MLRYLHLGPVLHFLITQRKPAHNYFFRKPFESLHKEVVMMGGKKFAPKNQLALYCNWRVEIKGDLFQQLFFREYKLIIVLRRELD